MSDKKDAKRRRTVARHAHLTSPSRWGQIVRFLAVGLAVVLVAGGGVVAYRTVNAVAAFQDNSVQLEGHESVPPDIAAIEGGVNMLISGTDACEPAYADLFGDRCTGADAGGELNDVNLLLHISDEPRTVTVVSFPRDLMVPIPACTDPETGTTYSAMSKQMLNTTFSYGGLACAVATISELTGQEIPFAASITWGGVIEVTEKIGGVDVCVENGIKDYHTGLDLSAGTHNLSGLEALQFLRTRHGVGNGGDLSRISNQQQYMSRLARKLVSEETFSNPGRLYELALTALENVTVSSTLQNPMTLVQIALAVKNVPFEEIQFLQYPVYDDPSDRNRVVPNYDDAQVIWDAFAENRSLQINADADAGAGVVVEEPTEGTSPTPTPTESTPATPAPGATGTPDAGTGAVVLPPSISGQSAAMETCSNGNVRG